MNVLIHIFFYDILSPLLTLMEKKLCCSLVLNYYITNILLGGKLKALAINLK